MIPIASILLSSSIGLLAAPAPAPSSVQEASLPSGEIEVTRAGLLESLLGGIAKAESEDAWAGGDRPVEDARILLAFLSDGHSVRYGDHRELLKRTATKFINRFEPKLGSPFERGPENDLAHAMALATVAEFWIIDEVPGLESRVKAAAVEAIKRQGKDGLWGEDGDELEATMRMVLGLCSARSGDLKISNRRFEATFDSMDKWIDPKTGAAKVNGAMDDKDVLGATSLIVATKLMARVDPSRDKTLAKSIEWLTGKLGDPKEAVRWSEETADPAFWERTTLAAVQIFGKGKPAMRWGREGARALAPEALRLTRKERVSDPERAAAIVTALTAVFRYGPGEFAPGKD